VHGPQGKGFITRHQFSRHSAPLHQVSRGLSCKMFRLMEYSSVQYN
jgi:hypothetical protein